ncbi:MAG: transposase [Kribbellaceae bacterium]
MPAPVYVVDRFHAIKLANAAIDDIRRRVQQETLGHRGRSGDPLYGIRRVLLRGAERSPHGEVVAVWIAKEDLRRVYAAADQPPVAWAPVTGMAGGVPAGEPGGQGSKR